MTRLEPVVASDPPELHDAEAAPPEGAPAGRALRAAIEELNERLGVAQELLAASGKTALLVVLQGRDTAGKDGTIRNVFAACNPQGCRVTAFAAPSALELSHDYLWRVHAAAPPRGMIYNWWMMRTRSLGDLVLTHAVTNAALSAYVILGERWTFWM